MILYAMLAIRLSVQLNCFWDECQFGYSNHDDIVFYSSSDLVESEILRKDDRPRECPIKTLLYEHATSVEIDGGFFAISW